jgi:hypothetical protein
VWVNPFQLEGFFLESIPTKSSLQTRAKQTVVGGKTRHDVLWKGIS